MYTILLKTNLYTQGFSSLGYLLFEFSPKGGNRQTLWKENKIICFTFRNIFFHKNTVKESEAPSVLQKEKRGLENLMLQKCYIRTWGKSPTLLMT